MGQWVFMWVSGQGPAHGHSLYAGQCRQCLPSCCQPDSCSHHHHHHPLLPVPSPAAPLPRSPLQEHETALRYFQRALQLDPTLPYAYTLAGHEYFANEDFEKGISCYRNAIRIDPRHYNAW